MIQEKILKQFIDFKKGANKRFIELLESSISFTAKEKAFMIIDFYKYSGKQIDNLVKVLENDYRQTRNLKEKHPTDYQERKIRTENAWEFMLEQLQVYSSESKKKHKTKLTFEEIQKIKKEIGL